MIRRALPTALAAILFALGWIAGKIALAVSWTRRRVAVSWVGAAIKIGWEDAHKRREQITR